MQNRDTARCKCLFCVLLINEPRALFKKQPKTSMKYEVEIKEMEEINRQK